MVVETEQMETQEQPAVKGPRRQRRGGLRRLISSVMRLLDTQYRILMLRAKMTLMRMAIYAALFAGAVVLGLVGVIFLYIGIFHLLTDLCGLPRWATFLLYAGIHIVTAVILVTVGTRMLSAREDDDDDDDDNAKTPKAKTPEKSK